MLVRECCDLRLMVSENFSSVSGGLAVGAHRIDVLDQAVVAFGDAGVAEGDASDRPWPAPGRPCSLMRLVVHVFEQAGILACGRRCRCKFAGLVGLDDFAGLFLAVDPHGELANAGPLGNGEKIGRFELAGCVIAERLLDPRDRHLIVDGDGDFLIDERQRRQLFSFGIIIPPAWAELLAASR